MAGYYGDMGQWSGGAANYERQGASSAEGAPQGQRLTPFKYSQITTGRNPADSMAALGGPATVNSPGTGLQVAAREANAKGQAHDASYHAFMAQNGTLGRDGTLPAGPIAKANPYETGVIAQHAATTPQAPVRPGVMMAQRPANIGVPSPAPNPDLQGLSQSSAANAPGVAAPGVSPAGEQGSADVTPFKLTTGGRDQSPADVSAILASQNARPGPRVGVQGGSPRGNVGVQDGPANPMERAVYNSAASRYGHDMGVRALYEHRDTAAAEALSTQYKQAQLLALTNEANRNPDDAAYYNMIQAGRNPAEALAAIAAGKLQRDKPNPAAGPAGPSQPGIGVPVNGPPTRPGVQQAAEPASLPPPRRPGPWDQAMSPRPQPVAPGGTPWTTDTRGAKAPSYPRGSPPAPMSPELMAVMHPKLSELFAKGKDGSPLNSTDEIISRAIGMNLPGMDDPNSPLYQALAGHAKANAPPGGLEAMDPGSPFLQSLPEYIRTPVAWMSRMESADPQADSLKRAQTLAFMNKANGTNLPTTIPHGGQTGLAEYLMHSVGKISDSVFGYGDAPDLFMQNPGRAPNTRQSISF